MPRSVAQKTGPEDCYFRACFWSSRVLRRLCMEAAGIEPASRDVSTKASTCVVDDLNFARITGQRHPEIQAS